MSTALKIGTRGSALALWQARHVAAALAALPGAPPTELAVIKTAGDRQTELPLWQVEGKSFFTREIEEALLAGRIDLAVHSLKDLATADPPGLALAAILARDDPRDVLIARPGIRTLDDLPPGARVGTSSLRRRALLARLRGDLELLDLRGNVPTRIERLDEGRYDAIVLAAAGLKRLGLEGRISGFLEPEQLLPAPGQGALAVQVRVDDEATRHWVERLDDAAARATTTAERAFLARLEGGCQVPVGALAELDGSRLRLAGVVCALDGTRAVEGRRDGAASEAVVLGVALAEELLRRGAGESLTPRSPLPPHPEAARTGEGTPPPLTPLPPLLDGRLLGGPGEGDRGGEALSGSTIAITRPEPPGGPLERRLLELGARVLRWHSVEIAPPADAGPLCEAAAQLGRYDWIAFASAHAVQALAAATEERKGPRVAAVGPGTAEAAREAGFEVERVPATFSAAGLVASFRAAGDAPGARILLPASAEGRPELAEGLTALGARVEVVEAYCTLPAALDAATCRAALEAGEVDAITFTSPSAVEAFAAALGVESLARDLARCAVISIGPTTTAALTSAGRAPDAEASPSTLEGVVEVLSRSLARRPPRLRQHV